MFEDLEAGPQPDDHARSGREGSQKEHPVGYGSQADHMNQQFTTAPRAGHGYGNRRATTTPRKWGATGLVGAPEGPG